MIWFWFFMLLAVLLVPCTMIGFGNYFLKGVSDEIDESFGYRTSMSMKNRDTWQFAHKYVGRLWLRLGWLMLPFSLLPLLCVFGRDVETVGAVGMVVSCVQLVLMLGSIIPTERALKKTFDRNGRRKNP